MKGFDEGFEKEISFEDLIAIAREIQSKDLLPDVREVYIADSGKFNVKMKIPYTEDFYGKMEESVKKSQNLYNQVRFMITEQFDDFDSDSWNSTAIGKALRIASELFVKYIDNLSRREPYDSAELLYLLESLGSFGKLIDSDEFKKMIKNKKLEALNEGAEKFLMQIKVNANFRIFSNLVQMILLVADRDDTVGVELKKVLSSSAYLGLYPTLKKFVADN